MELNESSFPATDKFKSIPLVENFDEIKWTEKS